MMHIHNRTLRRRDFVGPAGFHLLHSHVTGIATLRTLSAKIQAVQADLVN